MTGKAEKINEACLGRVLRLNHTMFAVCDKPGM
jgi:hypothetical protein